MESSHSHTINRAVDVQETRSSRDLERTAEFPSTPLSGLSHSQSPTRSTTQSQGSGFSTRLLRSACRKHRCDPRSPGGTRCLCTNYTKPTPRQRLSDQVPDLIPSPPPLGSIGTQELELGTMSETNNTYDPNPTPNRPRSRSRRGMTPVQPPQLHEPHNLTNPFRNGSISSAPRLLPATSQQPSVHGSRIQTSDSHLSSRTRVHEYEESILESSDSISHTESFAEKTKSVCASFFSSKSDTSNMSYWSSGIVKNGGCTNNRRSSNIYYTSDDDEYEAETITPYTSFSRPYTSSNPTKTPPFMLKPFHVFQSWVSRLFTFIGVQIYSLVMLSLVLEKWLLQKRRVLTSSRSQTGYNGTPTLRRTHVPYPLDLSHDSSTQVPDHPCRKGVPSPTWDVKGLWRKMRWLLCGLIGVIGSLVLCWLLLSGIGISSLSRNIDQLTADNLVEITSPLVTLPVEPSKLHDIESRIVKMEQLFMDLSHKIFSLPPPPPVVNFPDLKAEIITDVEARILVMHNQMGELIKNQKPTADPEAVKIKDYEAQIAKLFAELKKLEEIVRNAPVPTCNCPPTTGIQSPMLDSKGTCSRVCVDLIAQAIAKYDADKTGIPDLALESAGGSVVSTRCTKRSDFTGSTIRIFGFPIWFPSNSPRKIIQPGTMPGDCWSFEGAEGYAVLKLVGPTLVSGFTLEHLAKNLSPSLNIDSAPRIFKVVGLAEVDDTENEHVFGEYEYKEDGSPLQYFEVQNSSTKAFPYVELKVISNHGNPVFTCIYRFRVHGLLEL